jgi:hypothetical protein
MDTPQMPDPYQSEHIKSSDQKARISGSVLRWVVLLGVLAAALFGALWLTANPDAPLISIGIGMLVVPFFIIVYIRFIRWLRRRAVYPAQEDSLQYRDPEL